MPPRRPGGKYRGAVSRVKGETTLAKEFEDGRSRMLQKYIKEQEEKKRAGMLGELAAKVKFDLNTKAGKSVQIKVVSFMMESQQELLRDVFRLWLDGQIVSRKETEVLKRTRAWRSSCQVRANQACDCCESYHKLTDAVFKMPFELARDAARRREEELKAALDAKKPLRRLPLPALSTSLQHMVSRTASGTALHPRAHKNQLWPCKCKDCLDPSTLDVNFVDVANATTCTHFKTGRRVFLDEGTMRFVMLDATKVHTLSSSSII